MKKVQANFEDPVQVKSILEEVPYKHPMQFILVLWIEHPFKFTTIIPIIVLLEFLIFNINTPT